MLKSTQLLHRDVCFIVTSNDKTNFYPEAAQVAKIYQTTLNCTRGNDFFLYSKPNTLLLYIYIPERGFSLQRRVKFSDTRGILKAANTSYNRGTDFQVF